MRWWEWGFIVVDLFNPYLPVAIATTHFVEQRGFPENVKALVYARDWVKISFGNGIRFLIIDTKT